MRVQVHPKFCFLCVLTFLCHQGNHCHEQDHSHHRDGHDHSDSDLQISQPPYVRGGPLVPESNSPQGHYLEEEQHFYIQQLFNRYGQKGRLDFHGFQSLLFSLGLGEVKVVGVKHDELGHDHVSHLDLLDVQGGLYMHSPVKEGQSGHDHSHGHPHHDHDHDQDSHDPHTEPDPKGCNQQTTADTPVAGRPAGDELNHGHGHDHNHHHDHDRNHNHHHDHDHDTEHNHNHTKVEDFVRKQDNGHVKEALKKKHKHEQTQVQSNNKNVTAEPPNPHNQYSHEDNGHGAHHHGNDEDHQHDHGDHHQDDNTDHQHDHGDHNHNDIHRVQVDSSLVQPEPPSSTSATTSQSKRPKKPAQIRGQRRRNKITPPPSMSEDHGHQSGHTHDHHDDTHRNTRKNKREVSGGLRAPSLPAAVLPLHQGKLAHQHEEVGLV